MSDFASQLAQLQKMANKKSASDKAAKRRKVDDDVGGANGYGGSTHHDQDDSKQKNIALESLKNQGTSMKRLCRSLDLIPVGELRDAV